MRKMNDKAYKVGQFIGFFILVAGVISLIVLMCISYGDSAKADTIEPVTSDLANFTIYDYNTYEEHYDALAGWMFYKGINVNASTDGAITLSYYNVVNSAPVEANTTLMTGTTSLYMGFWNPFYNDFRSSYCYATLSVSSTDGSTGNTFTSEDIKAFAPYVTVNYYNNRLEFILFVELNSGSIVQRYAVSLTHSYMVGTNINGQETIHLRVISKDAAQAYQYGYDKGKMDAATATQEQLDASYERGHRDGYQDAIEDNQTGLSELIITIIDTPIGYLRNLLGVELLGLNLFDLFTGIITAILGIYLVRLFL